MQRISSTLRHPRPFFARRHSILFILGVKGQPYAYLSLSAWLLVKYFFLFSHRPSRLYIPDTMRAPALFRKSGRYVRERDITMRVHSAGDCRCSRSRGNLGTVEERRRRDGRGSGIRRDGKLKKTTRWDETRALTASGFTVRCPLPRLHPSSDLSLRALLSNPSALNPLVLSVASGSLSRDSPSFACLLRVVYFAVLFFTCRVHSCAQSSTALFIEDADGFSGCRQNRICRTPRPETKRSENISTRVEIIFLLFQLYVK